MKKSLIIALFIMLLVVCIPCISKAVTVIDDNTEDVGGLSYKILSETNKTVEVVGRKTYDHNIHTARYEAKVTIPSTVQINGTTYTVISIRSMPFEYYLEEITLPNTLTSIGEKAFQSCGNLKAINIPSGVKSIGESAFLGCNSLTEVVIPSSVTSIGDSAFSGCDNIQKLTLPEGIKTIGNSAFTNCDSLKELTIPKSVTSLGSNVIGGYSTTNQYGEEIGIQKVTVLCNIGKNSFANARTLKEVVISGNTIGEEAFRSCENLSKVTLNNGVTTIGKNAFLSCTSIKTITIPSSVTKIDDYAFSGCKGLTQITIPKNVTTIGNYAFSSCENLEQITLSEGLKTIGNSVFNNCKSLTELTIPKSVTSMGTNIIGNSYSSGENVGSIKVTILSNVGKGSFSNCDSLKEVVVSGTTIEEGAFCYSKNLRKITLNPSVTTIKREAFAGCENLQQITISEGIKTIESYAFGGCTSLKELTIPKSVTSLGEQILGWSENDGVEKLTVLSNVGKRSFNNANTLKEVVVSGSTIAEDAFNYCKNLSKVTLNNGVTTIEKNAFTNCEKLQQITLPEGLKTIGDSAFSNCTGLTEITVPNTVTTIGKSAFSYSGLKKITLSNTVKTIENSTFSGCTSLESITIPNSVVEIKDSAFNGCNSLKNIVVPNSVKKLGIGAFASCANLETATLSSSLEEIPYGAFFTSKKLKTVVVPEGVKYIARTAFSGCSSLESITLPKSVERISSDSFDDCWNVIFYAYKNSYPVTYANNFNINVVYLDGGNVAPDQNYKEDVKVVGLVTIDKNVGASLSGTEIKEDTDVYKEMLKILKEENKDYTEVSCAYELNLDSGDITNGLPITFNVGAQRNGELAIVLHKKKNGEYEKFERKVTNGKIVITVTELSPFMVAFKENTTNGQAGNRELDDEPKTGIVDYTIYVNAIAIISVVGIAVLKFKK